MVSGSMAETPAGLKKPLDLLVVGSGPGGYRAAVLGALRGLQVGIVEKDQWGGCCLNRGCVPKKDWYHTARQLAASQKWAVRGVLGAVRGDLALAWAHQHGVVERVRTSYVDYMQRLGIRRYQGHAHFSAPGRVEIVGEGAQESVRAGHVILATGSEPVVPTLFQSIPGILTTDALYDRPPPSGDRVAVLGGGVIATEFAFILSLLGKEVRWFVRRPPLAESRFSAQALTALHRALAEYGIVPELVDLTAARGDERGVCLTANGAEVSFDWALLAAGRVPVTRGLQLEAGGVMTDRGRVALGASLETSAAGVFAIGDCAGGPMTANQALHDASLVVRAIVEGVPCAARSPERVPEVLYSALELARVGLTEDAAEDLELEPAVGFAAFETSPRALGQDEPEGFVRLLADMDAGTLLGGEVVGAEAGELIHLLAMNLHKPLSALAVPAYNHPTRSEEVLNATETLARKWGLAGAVFSKQDPS